MFGTGQNAFGGQQPPQQQQQQQTPMQGPGSGLLGLQGAPGNAANSPAGFVNNMMGNPAMMNMMGVNMGGPGGVGPGDQSSGAMGGGGQDPSSNGFSFNASSLNPQMQALLQQQVLLMQRQQAGQQQQQQQQQLQPLSQQQPQQQQQLPQGQTHMRWPSSSNQGVQQQATPFSQPFNPFQMSNPGQGAGIFNAVGQGQPSQQQQQQQMRMSQANPFSAMPQSSSAMDPQAILAAAAAANAGNPGMMVDPSSLLQGMQNMQQPQQQQQQNNNAFGAAAAGVFPGVAPNGIPPYMQQNLANQPQLGSPHTAQAASPAPSKASSQSTPHTEPKQKGRPKGSTKKKKEEARLLEQQRQQQQAQQRQQQQQQQQQAQAAAAAAAAAAASPAAAMHTPTTSHAMASHGSPSVVGPHPPGAIQSLNEQERQRSHTRSPSVSMGLGQQHPPPQSPFSMPSNNQTGAPIGWAPSLSAQQQQQLLGQALQASKARNSQGNSVSPAQILMQMGYVYVKANVLPNNGQGAGVPGGGAVLSIGEAKQIGLVAPQAGPSSGPSQPPHMPQVAPSTPVNQAAMPPPQHTTGYRPSPSAPGMASSPSQPGGIPPSSPASAMLAHAAGSPSTVGQATYPGAFGRTRQASVTQATRPDSRSGRPPTSDGQSFSPFAQPTSSTPNQVPAQPPQALPVPPLAQTSNAPTSAPQAAPFGPSAVAGPSNNGPSSTASTLAVTSALLPPINGGPLPKKTTSGFDVAEYNTRLTALPSSDALTGDGKGYQLAEEFKPLSDEEQKELHEIMRKDGEYTKLINAQAARAQSFLLARAEELKPFGPGAAKRLHWWERSSDEDQSLLGKDGPFDIFRVILPTDKRSEKAQRGMRSALMHHFAMHSNPATPSYVVSRHLKADRLRAAKLEEDLVPVRLEIDHEGWKLRDTFTWPAPESDHIQSLDRFAIMLCEDFGLPPQHFVAAVREAIQAQVTDHLAAQALRPKRIKGREAGRGRLRDGEAKWWKKWRTAIEEAQEEGEQVAQLGKRLRQEEEEAATGGDGVISIASPETELRIQIKLDITVGAMNLVDQFEWDLSDEGSSAEAFADTFAADLGLSGEFKTAIAHSIREQVDVHMRSLALVGHPFDGSDVLDDDLRSAMLPPVASVARTDQEVDSHTPRLHQLSEVEVLQIEREREREARRKRRQTRGRRGINLPDREPQKTQRTPAVFGLQNPNANGENGSYAQDIFATGGAGGRGSERGLAGMSTRRAAAAAANANIAPGSSMVHDFDSSTPGPEGPSSKRAKIDSHATHFLFPGGLGRVGDEDSDTDGGSADRGPKFAPKNSREGDTALLGSAAANRRGKTPEGAKELGGASSHRPTPTVPASSRPWNMQRPEDAIGQHPNFHDGAWYCSNCGVPGSLDTGRRKGPLGDKSLCGPCGKFYHRHRKSRPVEYTRDLNHHMRQQQARPSANHHWEADEATSTANTPAQNSGLSASNDSQMTHGDAKPSGGLAPKEEPSFPTTRGNSPELPFQQVGSPEDSDESRPPSPGGRLAPSSVRSSRSPSKKPELKRSISPSKPGAGALENGASRQSPSVGAASTTASASAAAAQAAATAATTRATTMTPAAAASAPDWLTQACTALRLRFPLDRFEVQLRPRPAGTPAPATPEWRVRCLDCPGKLYTPGPGETLTNFEIHLKNRSHRANVQKAVSEGRKPLQQE